MECCHMNLTQPLTKSMVSTILFLLFSTGISQHEFSKCKLCLTNSIDFCYEMNCSVDNGSAVDTIYLDQCTCSSFTSPLENLFCTDIHTNFFSGEVFEYFIQLGFYFFIIIFCQKTWIIIIINISCWFLRGIYYYINCSLMKFPLSTFINNKY